MNAIAALAAKEAAVVSGFGAGLLAPSAVDGFAVGTLLSGVCVLMVIRPRRRLRHARQGRDAQSSPAGAPANTACTAAHTDESPAGMSDPFAGGSPEVIATSAMPEASAVPEASVISESSAVLKAPVMSASSAVLVSSAMPEPSAVLVSSAMASPLAAIVASAPSEQHKAGHVQGSKNSGYRSKHKMPEPYVTDWRPESLRSAPRHAAPSHGVSSSMASRLPLYPLPVRD